MWAAVDQLGVIRGMYFDKRKANEVVATANLIIKNQVQRFEQPDGSVSSGLQAVEDGKAWKVMFTPDEYTREQTIVY